MYEAARYRLGRLLSPGCSAEHATFARAVDRCSAGISSNGPWVNYTPLYTPRSRSGGRTFVLSCSGLTRFPRPPFVF
jgi:hypothetical protein